ncbi:MAG TPA: hypothetical protein DCO79_08495 [Spirochaeta sp.]|nr:hypothetical protein [Spirochaeta sp.]
MDYGAINPGNTYLWLTLGGIFFGGGLSFLFTRRRRKPTSSIVFLSIAVLSLLAAFIFSGFSIIEPGFRLSWLGASAALGCLGFRFWKTIGIPLLFLLIMLASSLWYAFYNWQPADTGAEICSFSIISEGDDYVKVQYETPEGVTGLDKISGLEVYPELDIITLPDYFFLLSSNRVYRFYGFSDLPGDEAEASIRYGFIIKNVLRLPGIEFESASDPLNFAPSIDYSFSFDEDGNVENIKSIE